ncbi:MAG: polysaccharide export protein [candidate division Zixibacteria bacterium]|nr:polysaccharide export protein [Candidatus Tariuqbacter arcticus]
MLLLLGLITLSILLTSVGNAANDEYVIKPNDMIQTYTFGAPELNINTSVPPDGMISFPMAGEISVLGLTADNLTRVLEERLSHYLINPKVNVFITAYNPLKVYILGAVRVPGAYDYKPGTRLTDYISEAGGFDIDADSKHCYIYPLNQDKPRKEINLKKLLESPESDWDIEIEPFDTIFLKPKSGFMFSEWRDVADAINILLGVFTLYYIMSRG